MYSVTAFVVNFCLHCVEEVLDWEDENCLSKEFWISIKGSRKEKVNILVLFDCSGFRLSCTYMYTGPFLFINFLGNNHISLYMYSYIT